MKNITTFLENTKNKQLLDYYEYVVCISDETFNGDHQYWVENYWGPLREDLIDVNNKIKHVLGKHKCNKNTTCEVKIMDGEDLQHLLFKYNDEDISERELQDQSSKYTFNSFISKIK